MLYYVVYAFRDTPGILRIMPLRGIEHDGTAVDELDVASAKLAKLPNRHRMVSYRIVADDGYRTREVTRWDVNGPDRSAIGGDVFA